MIESQPERKISKRSKQGEGRPTKRTPEVVATLAAAIASDLTDREVGIVGLAVRLRNTPSMEKRSQVVVASTAV